MARGYRADYDGIGEMLCASWMQADMHRRAEAVMAAAVAASPVDTGDYVDSFEVESGVKHGKTSRAYGRVTNTSDHARAVEYGLGNTPAYRPLGKALDAAGD